MRMEAPPMHLHGQSFALLAANGTRYAEPLVKDVVDVEPHMGSAVIEFTAHHPGDWFLHCQKPMCMNGGMSALVKIAENDRASPRSRSGRRPDLPRRRAASP